MRLPAIFVLAVLAAVTSLASAQRTASGAHTVAPSGRAFQHFKSSGSFLGRNAHPSGFRRSSPYVPPYASLPFPFFGDSFNPDDIYSTGYPVASQPPAFLMQAVRDMAGSATDSMGPAMGPLPNHAPSSSQPLMIELQNGRYVRVSKPAVDGEALPLTQAPDTQPAKLTRRNSTRLAASGSVPPAPATASPAPALPPAVLIFRDGHSEEVRDYTIADGILYARGDYYTDGYWNKKIDLAALNLSETLQANANGNVKFTLPASPNEVITRP